MPDPSEDDIIRSTAVKVSGTGLAFRGYDYCKLKARFTPKGQDVDIGLDTGCSMTVIDSNFLKKHYPDANIKRIAPVDIKGIGFGITKSDEYTVLTIYIPGYKGTTPKIAALTREFHIVYSLPAGVLFGNDIITPEGMIIDAQHRYVTIGSCNNMVAALTLTKAKPLLAQHRMVRIASTTVVPPHSRKLVPIRTNSLKELAPDMDYRFSPKYTRSSVHLALHGVFPEAVVDANTTVVAYYNNSNHKVTVRANTPIGEITQWGYNERATPEDGEKAHAFFSMARIMPSMAFIPACPPFNVHRIHSLLAISFMCIPIPSSLLPTKHTNRLTRTPPQLPTTPQPPMILREHMTLPTHTPCSHPSTRNRVARLDSVHKRLMSTRRIIFPPTKPKVSEMCCRNSRRCGKTGLVE
jgi:hypothetical protein